MVMVFKQVALTMAYIRFMYVRICKFNQSTAFVHVAAVLKALYMAELIKCDICFLKSYVHAQK